jgi:pimeloyl-ACP methyl ester carboxylesterase/DNA-binding CsgD family transcriptional regulator
VLRPTVRYARCDDGVSIAYTSVGEGGLTILLVSPVISQVEVAWEEPALEQFWSRLAAFARVVMFDRRGTGLSDRPAVQEPSLDAAALDIKAVLDSCETPRAVLFGVTLGCPIAVHFAATHPDRADALILAGGFAKLNRLGGFDFQGDPAQVDEWAARTALAWGSGTVLGANAPAMRDNVRYREWAARLERHTCPPGSVEALCRWAAKIDVRPTLGGLRVPTLVLHRAADRSVPSAEGRYLARHIPGAEFVELPGEEHTLFLGDQRSAVDAVVRFLNRVLAGGTLRPAARRSAAMGGVGGGWDSLTPAEQEVARLVAAGMTNSQIATRLRMSPHTVDGRLRRVFAKVGVNTRVALTAEYARVMR